METQNSAMKYFAMVYEVIDGFIEKRTPFRHAHLALVRAAHARGELVMAGALGNPDGALFVFRSENDEVVNVFASSDPYVLQKLVRQWTIRPWAVVVGGDSTG
jgi:uncharacterized protein